MSNQQFLARIGVFVLIGLNVGAYYVFWPSQEPASKADKKAPKEEGQSKFEPATAKPKELPASPVKAAVPLTPPGPQASPDDLASRLLEHIKKEKEAGVVLPPTIPNPFDEKKFVFPDPPGDPPKRVGSTGDLPLLPMVPQDSKPNPLPPLKPVGDLPLPAFPKEFGEHKNVGVTSPLTPKVPESSAMWTFEVARPLSDGASIIAIATMKDRPLKWSFRCTKFEPGTSGADAVAEDAVLETPIGVTIRCKRLTFAHALARLTFEGQVAIMPAGTTYGMQSERVVWDFPVREAPNLLGPPR